MDYVYLCAGMFFGGVVAGFVAAGPQVVVYLWKRLTNKEAK